VATSLVEAHGRIAYPAGITGLTQFTFAALNSSGQLILPSANGLAIGIIDDAPPLNAAGQTLNTNGSYSGGFVVGVPYGVVFSGAQKVIAAATLAPMTLVATNAAGQAVAATGTGTFILGVTMYGCNSGDLVMVNVRTTGAMHS
jgi:hypothetical protein